MAAENRNERIKELSIWNHKLDYIALHFRRRESLMIGDIMLDIGTAHWDDDDERHSFIIVTAIKVDDWYFAIQKMTQIGRQIYYEKHGKEIDQKRCMIVGFHKQFFYYHFTRTRVDLENAENRLIKWFTEKISPFFK